MSFNIKKSLEVDYLAARIISSRDYATNVDASAGYVLTAMADGKAQWQPNAVGNAFQTIVLPDISFSTIAATNTSSLYSFQLQVSDPLTLDVVSSLNRIIIGLDFSNFVSVASLVSTVEGIGTGGGGGDISGTAFTSTVAGLGTAGYVSTQSLTSTTKGLRDYISSFIDPAELTSTVVGLGTSQYVSTMGLDAKLTSTVAGLGNIYVSIPSLTSTVEGLGSAGYISTFSLISTIEGLGLTYVSTPSLTSTVEGLGQIYISSLVQGDNILITGTAPEQNIALNPSMTAINSIGFNNGGAIDLSGGHIDNLTYINLIKYGSISFDPSGGIITFDDQTQNMADKRIDMAYGEVVNVGRMTLNGNSYIQFAHNLPNGSADTYIDMNKGSIRNVSSLWTSTLYADTINYNTLNPPINISLDLTSTVAGLGSAGYVSTQSLTSTVAGLGQRYISLPSLISTVEGLGQIYKSTIDTSGTLNLLSTVAGLGQIYISTPSLTSTVEGLGKTYISIPSLTSTVEGLGSAGYVSTQSLTSTVKGLGSAGYISNLSVYSTVKGLEDSISSFVYIDELTSTTLGLGSLGYISSQGLTTSLTSTVLGLGSAGYISNLSLYSSVKGIEDSISSFVDINELTSTTLGLGTLGYISTQGLVTAFTSTVEGLGSAGYISDLTLYSSVKGLEEYVSSFIDPTELTSTVIGLGTAQYVSTIGLEAKLVSTVEGLGSAGYVSTLGLNTSLTSTVAGLGSAGYVSTLGLNASLTSTVAGLGSANYVSNSAFFYQLDRLANYGPYGYVSTATLSAAIIAVKDEIIGGATGTYQTLTEISSILGDASNNSLSSLLGYVYDLRKSISDIADIFEADIADLSGAIADLSNSLYTNFVQYPYLNNSLASTVAGLGSANYISSLSLTSTVAGLGEIYVSTDTFKFGITSTVAGLGTAGYVSTDRLNLGLTSTVQGLGSASYVSSASLTSTVAGLGTAGYVSTDRLNLGLTSTVQGLGTAGYISTLSLTSTVAGLGLTYISIPSLTSTVQDILDKINSGSLTADISGALKSTVQGLGTAGYVSTLSLTSTVAGLTVAQTSTLRSWFPSTVTGLGSAGYVSTLSLISTVAGLGTAGYASTTGLTANQYTYVTSAGGPISGTSNFQVVATTGTTTVQHPVLNTWAEDFFNDGTSYTTGGTVTINCLYNNYRFTTPNSASATLTINFPRESASNIPENKVFGINLWITAGNATAATITYSGTNYTGTAVVFKWPGGTQPTLTSGTAGKIDIINLVTYDRGSNWFGFVAGKNY